MKLRAIVFEDDKTIRYLIKKILEMRGYEVIAYEDPAVCPLQKTHDCHCDASQVCADIIISDVDMPGISGLQFIKSQKLKGCKTRHIAFMSGRWTDPCREFAEELGCKVFNKPFDIKEIQGWLDDCEKKIDDKRILSDWFLEREY